MKLFRLKNLIPAAVAAILFSGCAGTYYMQGEHYYNSAAYNLAELKLEKALSMKDFPEAKHMLADAYRHSNNAPMSEKWYAESSKLPDAKPIELLYYAQALMQNEKYDEAKEVVKKYLTATPDDKIAQLMLASFDSIADFNKSADQYLVEELSINSGSSLSATTYDNGIVFASDRNPEAKTYLWTGRPYLDIYFAEGIGEGKFDTPQLMKGEVNGKYHDGVASFSPNADTMYFTRNNYKGKKVTYSKDEEVLMKIFTSTKNESGEWGNIAELPFNSNDYSCGHPCVADKGHTIYFVSDMEGGKGGSDIWMVKMEGGAWSSPINLGSTINTSMNEMYPNMYNDSVLYFASNGWSGLGGLDVFSSAKIGNGWTKPMNIGAPINTSHDDFSYMPDKSGKKGYFTSNRESSDGSIDKIYGFKEVELNFTLSGIVVHKVDQTPVPGATITLLNKTSGQNETTTTGADGKFTFQLKPNTDYEVSANKDGYFSKKELVSTIGKKQSEDMVVKLKLEMEKIELNKPIVLKNIYYDYDKADIRPDAAIELDKLVKILKDNPSIKVELSSHTDCRGTNDYNTKLAQARAESAVKYIISKGISKDRITAMGYGETVPTVKCDPCEKCNEEQHQSNRRTEFKVIGFLDLK